MKIVIAADHRGFQLKKYILTYNILANLKIEWYDVGTYSQERTDYPIFAQKAVESIYQNKAEKGIIICGSGIGMAIAANRFEKIYAGVVWNEDIARVAKEDDNVNVLVLPSDFINPELAINIITAWLLAKFKDERYAQRLEMIDTPLSDIPSI